MKGKLHDDVGTVTRFSQLGDEMDTRLEYETEVISQTKSGWVKFGDKKNYNAEKIFSESRQS